MGQVTTDESSTDPQPPPPSSFTGDPTPVVPPRPSKSSASSSLASSPDKEGKVRQEAEGEEEEENEDDGDEEEEEEEEDGGSSSAFGSQLWGPERRVEIRRVPNQGLGISIVGGKVDPPPSSSPAGSHATVTGIFIKNVLENSPAGQSGLLHTGDRILEVDGTNLRNAAHDEAVDVIRQSGSVVVFVVQSLLGAAASATPAYKEEKRSVELSLDNVAVLSLLIFTLSAWETKEQFATPPTVSIPWRRPRLLPLPLLRKTTTTGATVAVRT